MQPRDIEKLDPFYANEQGFIEFEARNQLHEVTVQLNDIVEQQGQPVADSEINTKIFEMLCVGDPSIGEEVFFRARILPPHDTLTTPHGGIVPSRLLVVDARHPISEAASKSNPGQRIRAYFVVFGEGPPEEPGDILPYYVVSDREITAMGKPDEMLHHQTSTVFYSPTDAWPLHRGDKPMPVHEPEPYAAMAAELELAVNRLSGGSQGSYQHTN